VLTWVRWWMGAPLVEQVSLVQSDGYRFRAWRVHESLLAHRRDTQSCCPACLREHTGDNQARALVLPWIAHDCGLHPGSGGR
jgi:hypothetical protein